MADIQIEKFPGVMSDQKVRLIAKDPSIFLETPSLLDPLKSTQGVVFPFTPNIQMSHDANYGTYDVVHSNYQSQYYTNSPNPNIALTAMFTSQTEKEVLHTAAALHFFRSCTKMDFGEDTRSSTAGTPPPVLLLSAFGILHAKNIPVVLRNFSYTMPEDVDYVSFSYGGTGEVMSLPTQLIVSLTFGVQYTGERQREFNIKDYRQGRGLNDSGKGFI